jgi:hypothetical protein
MREQDGLPNGEPVQMKVCIFQGYEDDDNPEILATFYTDRDGNVHVDNEAFYDTVRGIVSRGARIDGHDGIAFLHAVRAYFPGPHIWAGEVVPLYPKG